MRIPAELKELSKIFSEHGKKLYIVGGFVRDAFLGIQSVIRNDIDLCSSVKPKELKKMLTGTAFEVKAINETVGVMAVHGKKRYEHATFRREIYESESHTPDKIEFISSVEEDALRRDFKVNAIYYDIELGEYVDPLGGILDLKEQVITTTKVPKVVFNDDPERILRLVRFACSLGLKIPEDELYYAKQNAYKIQFISKFRLKNEFERLLTADEIYPELLYTREAHYRAMVLLGELGAWQFILPAIQILQDSPIVDEKGERIYEHVLNCLKNASPKIRLAVLLHDSAKHKTMESQRNFFGAKEFVGVIVEKNLGMNGLGYSKETVDKVTRTILGYDFNNWGLAPKNTVKKYILENRDIIENVIEIKNVVKNENRSNARKIKSAVTLRKVYNDMIKERAPFERKDLELKGDDIIKLEPNIRLENIDTLLDKLLSIASLNSKKNNKETLTVLAHKVINSNREFYLED